MVLAVCLLCLWVGRASALGTAAGTTIANTASVTYTLGSDPTSFSASAFYSFEVLEVIDLNLVWQDATNVPVASPHTDAILSFLLTNTGNGPEDFRLSVNETLGGDQFDPAVQSLWLETNGIAGLQADDTAYPASGVTLSADEALPVYVVSNIPAGLAHGDTGRLRLSAAAQTPGAAGQAPGTLLPNAGFNNGDALVGTGGAGGEIIAAYEVAGVSVTLTKSIVRIDDLNGGDRPFPGARVTYRIVVAVGGNGTAEALEITDPIPADMTYAAGSMVLDGSAQTDGADGDRGDFNVSAADTVTVNLSDTVAPATHTIEFSTTIN